ncbi:flagellar biosynthesis protein FlhF [Desulfosalsimonas propionicica]|uniref:Flagellar biosynthesis protein FlhF n=1 Tax=Desulfosalsimonas propionicica TaxID=332175 RepID=A0A7W0C8X0_9BACT|nr:flagellar biosynthesis protein FlhF [Desulfosalsimonas propionicica]MBA2881317.1 flagellar biosynthesis protein FlhF [Desulfosalsimonas propionicica]
MQVKVFEAADMRSAIEKVKKALGPDALILSTRSLADSKQGRVNRSGIEVTAAVDADLSPASSDTAGTGFQQVLEKTRKPAASSPDPDSGNPPEDSGLMAEFRQMKRSFENLSKKVARWEGRMERGLPAGPAQGGRLPGLSGLGISDSVLELLAESACRHEDEFLAGQDPDPRDLLIRGIRDHIRIENPLSAGLHGQRRLVFMGPTGVGKTTTIAKVAACAMLHYGKKIVLATIDNYRIAAAEQLKIYGQIMDVSVELARSPDQLADIFQRHADKDLILVDTAGRSPRDDMRRNELAAYLDPALKTENHLVLSATTGQQDLEMAIDRFSSLDPAGLVLTKLDECEMMGQILNAAVCAGRPLSFFTNGQQVPEDLLFPEPDNMAEMILNPEEVVAQWNTPDTRIRPEHCVN